MEKPKDIGLVVVTKREALYMKVRDAAIQRIEQQKEAADVDNELLKLSKKIIEEEHAL